MRGQWAAAGLVLAAAAVPAAAADTLAFGPAPAWVQPVEAPAAPPGAGGLAVRLVENQTRYDAEGAHSYSRQVTRIASPEALQTAGTVSATWQPAMDRVTINRLVIHRDGRTIDVLGDGKLFQVIRREGQLESARTMDGQLTGIAAVPDLRVGDELEFATTIDRRNPVLAGHVESDAVLAGGVQFGRLYLRASWPKARPIRWRAGEGLPKPRVTTVGGETALVIDQAGARLPELPAAAPGRYADIGRLQLSDFADWQSVSRLMAPLFADAERLGPDSPLRAEIGRIARDSADPLARAGAALALVQGQVRYLADVRGLGGYVPTPAEAVWRARLGDCKGKTVLLLALLHGLGIDARPALVPARQPDGADRSLPMPGRFDHVVVEARIAGRSYWLDGTRWGDRDLARIEVPPFRWALPLSTAGEALVPIAQVPAAQPLAEWRLDLDARKGVLVPAAATGEVRLRGDQAVAMRQALSILDQAAREQMVRAVWTERHDWLTVKSVRWTVDEASGEVVLGFAGEAPMDWSIEGTGATYRYEADRARLGTDLSPTRKPGIGSDAPVEVAADYSVARQTILLPDGGKGFYLQGGDPIDETAGGIRYTRTATLRGDRFDMAATTRTAAHEVSLADAKAADERTDAIFARRLFVHMPAMYDGTEGDRASITSQVASKDADLAQVIALSAKKDYAGALKAVDGVITKRGRLAPLLALRAGIAAQAGDMARANTDADAALAVDARDPTALFLKAALLSNAKRWDDATILLDRLILVQPAVARPYLMRAMARIELKQGDGALSDLAILLEKEPDNQWAHVQRIKLLNAAGRRDEALVDADTFVKLLPEDEIAHALRGNVLATVGRMDEAKAELARSIALVPNADAYATRLAYNLSGDADGQLADMLAVIRLDPDRSMWRGHLRPMLADPGRYAQVAAAYDAAVKAHPEERAAILKARGEVETGRMSLEQMLAVLDAKTAANPKDATLLNSACWERATANFQLDRALKDCDASVAIAADDYNLDSRGFVKLRLGRDAEAIRDFDAALARQPQLANSLFGRGIAKLRRGDRKGGEADLAAARKVSSSIDGFYRSYGVEVPAGR